MNKIDLQNIKNELKKRNTKEPEFKEGGELTEADIVNATTENLEKMVADFNDQKRLKAEERLKNIVDDIFEKFNDDPDDVNTNMIVIGACNYYDDSRCISISDSPLTDIDFTGFGNKYNKIAYPIGRDWDLSDFGYEGDKEDDAKYEALMKSVEKIEPLFKDLGLQSIENYWDEDNEAINEVWYGVHAITKDYKIVTFVIRDDGMLCDEEGFDSFHNHIIYEM